MDTQILVDAVEKVNTYLESTGERKFSRTEEALSLILWNAREYGTDVDTSAIGEILTRYTQDSNVLSHRLEQTVTEYLLSPVSEVPVAKRSRAEALANAFTRYVASENFRVTATDIEQFFRIPLFELSEDDAFFLAPSLENLLVDTRGELRNEQIWVELTPLLPDSVIQNTTFRKEVTGALWELNQTSQDNSEISTSVNLATTHTGLPPILKQMEEELTPTQIESVLLALVLIVALFSLIFRSLKVGFLGIVPLILTIMLNFAVMALLNIGLDSFTAMIASLTIGLGVDYAVHFTSRFQREMQASSSAFTVVNRTLETTGRAIIINAFAVGIGFAVLLLAGGQHIRRFGGLTSFTMITAAVLTLTLLPAVFLVFNSKKKKMISEEEI